MAEHLNRRTGIDAAFLSFYLNREPLSFSRLGEAFAAWLMCVEYVNDLTRLPYLDELKPLKQLSSPLQAICKQLIQQLRQHHPNTYVTMAATIESHLERELKTIQPEDCGKIDTFQCQETVVLDGAVQALLRGELQKAYQWANSCYESPAFWLQRDPTRRLVWALVGDAAHLGHLIQKTDRPLKLATSLREALEYYTRSGYEIDRAHRRFEQQRLKLLEPTLPYFAQLLEVADQLRVCYRVWADWLAADFANICALEGFLPDEDLQQRHLYEQVVHPLCQKDSKVAYFLIDAFRYEMATELLQEFEGAGTTVTLKGRYAELPTITAVGMNALAPVSQSGRLVLAGGDGFGGFKTGEYTVRKPDERVRAVGDRSVDNINAGRKRTRDLRLSEVCNYPTASLKKSCANANANLIVVHSKEIDDAGEANVGLATFETWLQQIKSAWSHLKSIGITEFVLTADHGFLFQDQTTQKQPYGTKHDPDRRHVFSLEPRSEDGTILVSLNALKYDGQQGYLLFRKDTAVFATGTLGATFVHGGNSLQERIIPVLTVSHRYRSEVVTAQYQIEPEALPEAFGCSRIRLQVKPAPDSQSVLSFVGVRDLNLALRVPSRPDIKINIKEAVGAEVKNQLIRVKVEGDWVEVFFDLKGMQDERVRVEVFPADGIEQVEPTVPTAYFNVSGSLQGETPTVTEQGINTDWQDSFEDDAVRNVFLHLQQHGSITESELNQMLGSARRVRRFSLEFEEYLKKVPFSVKIETTNNGKRYIKQVHIVNARERKYGDQ